jgi:hypothetical protein
VTTLVLLQDASGPAVWLQLLEQCAAEPDCPPEAVRTLAQLAEQRAVANGHQQQLTDQQQQLLAPQQQVLDQQEQLSAQQVPTADPLHLPAEQLQGVGEEQQGLVAPEQQLHGTTEQGVQDADMQALHSQLQQLLQD